MLGGFLKKIKKYVRKMFKYFFHFWQILTCDAFIALIFDGLFKYVNVRSVAQKYGLFMTHSLYCKSLVLKKIISIVPVVTLLRKKIVFIWEEKIRRL